MSKNQTVIKLYGFLLSIANTHLSGVVYFLSCGIVIAGTAGELSQGFLYTICSRLNVRIEEGSLCIMHTGDSCVL